MTLCLVFGKLVAFFYKFLIYFKKFIWTFFCESGAPTLLFYMELIENRIKEIARSIADSYGVEIVDVEMKGNLRKPTVQVFIDKEGGVNLDDCERFSRALSTVLDVEDPIRTPYVLEVSSPGLDRPLKNIGDFEKNTGKLVRVITRTDIDKQNFFVGRITGVSGSTIALELEKGKTVGIDFNNISKARLEVTFK